MRRSIQKLDKSKKNFDPSKMMGSFSVHDVIQNTPYVKDVWNTLFSFAPHDKNKLWQILPQMMPGKTSGVDRIKGFRYPSPGSQENKETEGTTRSRVPVRDNSDELYDVQYYTKNPLNFKSEEVTGYNTSSKEMLAIDTNVAVCKDDGSKPDGNPAVLAYDPTGLRSARSASWSEFDNVIEARRKLHAEHQPTYAWGGVEELEEINKAQEEKGLPPVSGKKWIGTFSDDNYNQVRW